jgi:hypothetical protein
MIEAPDLDLAVADVVELTFSDLISITGTVVWRMDGSAGVRFDAVLSDRMLARLGIDPSIRMFEDAETRDRFGQLLAMPDQPASADVLPGAAAVGPALQTAIPVRIAQAGGECWSGILTALTSSGCRFAEAPSGFASGQRILMHIGNLEEWPATVLWAAAGELEIEFDRPLHPAVVDHLCAANSSAPE